MKIKKPTTKNTSQNRNIQIVIGILAVLFVIFLLYKSQSLQQEGVQKAILGKSVGDFTLLDLDDKTVNLSDYQGKYVLLNAWATWCPPCRAEMPDLNKFYEAHQDKGFEILAINAGETREIAAQFADTYGLGFKIVLDSDSNVLNSLGITGFPTSILIDPQGKVAIIHIGMIFPEDLNNKVLPLLK
ncbi:MAG: TlpA disulfide reductase family protein [Anaerolineaceae bacterium]|jgi:thiol-disulfide isomerase/thioredoxin|nr:TlpA disulfide reductase family protein [Anaerolineaceae bacterium]